MMGGKSIEREVSFNSGRTVCDHLDTAQYIAIPIFQTVNGLLYILPQRFLHRGKISDFEHRLHQEAQKITWDELKHHVDLIYIAQHGSFGEDGRLQGTLEMLRIPYCGSKVFASALGMDKHIQKTFLAAAGIAVPKSIIIRDVSQLPELSFTFPVIVKPVHEGSSLGISVVTAQEELADAITKASYINGIQAQPVIVEEYIVGMEFSCIVITDIQTGEFIPLPPTEIITDAGNIFDYEQKYMPGRALKYTPARCNAQHIQTIQDTCIAVMKALDFTNLGRIDGFLKPDGSVVIIDPNSFSGMAPTSFAFLQAAQINMSHTQLINHLIKTELHEQLHANIMSNNHQETASVKQKIAILMGGSSNEKEISLESGRNVTYKLSPHTYEAVPIFVNSQLELYKLDQKLLVLNTTQEIEEHLTPELKISWSQLPELVDFVFIALHGGEGENGCVQGMLEMLGIPYNGSSVLTSALCMDKFKTNLFLRNKGFEVPAGILVNSDNTFQELTKQLPPFPVIVKPHDDGCSVLVHKAHNEQELNQALQALYSSGKTHALIE